MYKKLVTLAMLTILIGCQSDKKQPVPVEAPITETDTARSIEPVETKVYSNQRFRNVTVTKGSGNNFTINGEAQIFEANFSWVIEDGHNELQSGHVMTDAGAPEWGNFSFTVDAKKDRENSTLMLLLFESSAKDGSRQYELPVVLK